MLVEIGGRRILFVHIPKTGGHSVEKLLGLTLEWPSFSEEALWGYRDGLAYQHLTIGEILGLTSHSISSFDLIFTVIRDPVERFLSACNYSDLEIKEVIEKIKDDRLDPFVGKHFLPQHRFVDGFEDRVLLIDFRCLDTLPERLGLQGRVGHHNPSKKRLTRDSLDGEDLAFLGHHYRCDFDLYRKAQSASARSRCQPTTPKA
jgi:hypothetical protein